MADGDLHRIFDTLGRPGVRYLVVGGVAVVLHGHPRFTADLDLVLSLDGANVRLALTALASIGYRPRAPVQLEAFADPVTRQSWIADKGLIVFSLWSAEIPATEVDLFVEEPFPFEEAYARGTRVELGSIRLVVASIEDIIAIKRAADRPRDHEDIAALEAIVRSQGGR